MDWGCKDKLNFVLSNNRKVTANGKFDSHFLRSPSPTNKIKEGFIIIEQDGIKYKIFNHQKVLTNNGLKEGCYLQEPDIIVDFSNLNRLE